MSASTSASWLTRNVRIGSLRLIVIVESADASLSRPVSLFLANTCVITGKLFVTSMTSVFSVNSVTRFAGSHVGDVARRTLYTKCPESLS